MQPVKNALPLPPLFLLVSTAALVQSCGDIIKGNPFRDKEVGAYEPPYSFDATEPGFGKCPSFDGLWKGKCEGETAPVEVEIGQVGCSSWVVDHLEYERNVRFEQKSRDGLNAVTTVQWNDRHTVATLSATVSKPGDAVPLKETQLTLTFQEKHKTGFRWVTRSREQATTENWKELVRTCVLAREP